jgi:hypothetical protein
MMILFGGGDGGGIWVDGEGHVHHIPPWSPDALRQLKAAVAVLSAADRLDDKKLAAELRGIGERLTTAAIPQVARAASQAGTEIGAVAFLDGDDGFVCGSTGKRPGHFPIPHGPGPAVHEAGAFAAH